jgi:outer membrane protein OmpA-like peptidoglycan-associated protein
MERGFGQDFSQVRIHTDGKAADSADAVHAHAYTVGTDIVFGASQYSSHNQSSRHLLAHELTHVVQQTSGGVGADAESIADATATRVAQGKNVEGSSLGSAPVTLQRQAKDDGGNALATSPTATDPSTEPPVDEFDFDKDDIPPQHLARLGSLRMRLLTSPNATVVLTGHTDTVGNEKYNLGLGRRRANAIRDFLSKGNGVNPVRIEVQSAGEGEPAAGQAPARRDPEKGEKNAKNRRVEILIKGTLTSDRPTATPPAQTPGTGKPIIPGPGGPMVKELCIVYPDLCKPNEPPRLPPDFWKPIPPAKRPQKSPLDVINENIVDPVVDAVTKGLPKPVREKIRDLAHDGVEKGLTSAASSAASAAGIDSKGQQAIEKAVEAALKYKGQQPGQEGK